MSANERPARPNRPIASLICLAGVTAAVLLASSAEARRSSVDDFTLRASGLMVERVGTRQDEDLISHTDGEDALPDGRMAQFFQDEAIYRARAIDLASGDVEQFFTIDTTDWPGRVSSGHPTKPIRNSFTGDVYIIVKTSEPGDSDGDGDEDTIVWWDVYRVSGMPGANGAFNACPATPGDLAPGVLDESTEPPTFRVIGDGSVDVGDVLTLLRAAVGLQTIDCGPNPRVLDGLAADHSEPGGGH